MGIFAVWQVELTDIQLNVSLAFNRVEEVMLDFDNDFLFPEL